MALCNLRHLYYWLMRSRAELLTVGFLPGPLVLVFSPEWFVFLPCSHFAKCWGSTMSFSSMSHPLWVGGHLPTVAREPPCWCRGANMLLSANKYAQGLRHRVATLLEIKDPSLRSKGNHLVPKHQAFHVCGGEKSFNHPTVSYIGVVLVFFL